MAAPYRNFWSLVGLTLGTVFFAYSSAEKHNQSSPAPVSTTNSTLTKPDISANNTPVRSETDTNNGLSLPEGPHTAVSSNGGTQSKDVESEIRASFDKAVETALTKDISPPVQSSTNDTIDRPAELPPLTVQPVADAPKVFDGAPGESSSSVLPSGIATTNVNLREGPGPQYLLVQIVKRGDVVSVIGSEAGWLHVRVSQTGQEGFINPKYLALQ